MSLYEPAWPSPRRLHAGDYGEGAWKARDGSRWLIEASALDARRVVQRRPGRASAPKVRQADMTSEAKSDDMGWPT